MTIQLEATPLSPVTPGPQHLPGLSPSEVLRLREQFGENLLPAEKTTAAWTILLNQLKSPLVYIILSAALISLLVGELGDFIIIMVVVVIDAILGFIQEFQAQKTYTSLKALLKPTTTVIRNGERQEIEVRELVPGDLVVLNAGEKVPGDGRLIESTRIQVDEAILTGESEPVKKDVESVNLVFMGTTISTGRGLMQVSHTGLHTELGQIAASLKEHEEEDTPLQVRLKAFSKTLTLIVVGFTTVIMVIGLLLGRDFMEMLRTAIVLAIAAVPEGLLIAVTVILVLGMRKVLKRNGLVKQMLAVETLGSVTDICTDKTGTLTEGQMRVSRCELINPEKALEIMILCNNLEGPVDQALWEHALSQSTQNPQDLVDGSIRYAEELFTSETKYMITDTGLNGERNHYLKGAPEIVVEMCDLNPDQKNHILSMVEEWAGEGLRLLGLAYRPSGDIEDHNDFIWTGLLGLEDPVRQGVADAVRLAHQAGIRVKMITGDYRRTAERIGRNIGLYEDGDNILEGAELTRLSDDALRDQVRKTTFFARIRPNDKLRIVKAIQGNGGITAMIGDGVNDAPALQKANIGVVVGSATDVAKETSDLILLDNNFRTIVAAVEEGRVIFENIRKVVAYTLSNSFAEVLTVFTAMILGWPTPLLVAQILWIHLICDGPSDIVLGFEPKENGIMEEKPKSLKEPVLTNLGLSLIAVISITSAILALALFGYYYNIHGDVVEGRSLVFASFAVNSMVYIIAYRSLKQPLYKITPLNKNKPLVWAVIGGLVLVAVAFAVPELRELLSIVMLTWQQWLLVIGIAILLLLTVELSKAIRNWIGNRKFRTIT